MLQKTAAWSMNKRGLGWGGGWGWELVRKPWQ